VVVVIRFALDSAVQFEHGIDADFPDSLRDCDVSPSESVPAKSASFSKATHRCHSVRDSQPPTSLFHDRFGGEG